MKAFYSVMFLTLVAIFLAFMLGAFNSYFYPMTYADEIEKIGKECEVPPALIASVANVESGFNSESVSNKGAVGVMQLMPSTAEWVCKKNGLEFSDEKLKDPIFNIKVGAYYLAYLLNNFKCQETAVCAYNAGPTNVKNWLKDVSYSSDGETLFEIPFLETKNYLIKINKNLKQYSKKYEITDFYRK